MSIIDTAKQYAYDAYNALPSKDTLQKTLTQLPSEFGKMTGKAWEDTCTITGKVAGCLTYDNPAKCLSDMRGELAQFALEHPFVTAGTAVGVAAGTAAALKGVAVIGAVYGTAQMIDKPHDSISGAVVQETEAFASTIANLSTRGLGMVACAKEENPLDCVRDQLPSKTEVKDFMTAHPFLSAGAAAAGAALLPAVASLKVAAIAGTGMTAATAAYNYITTPATANNTTITA